MQEKKKKVKSGATRHREVRAIFRELFGRTLSSAVTNLSEKRIALSRLLRRVMRMCRSFKNGTTPRSYLPIFQVPSFDSSVIVI